MRGSLRSTNLRFNLDKELQRKAWDYLQQMDKKEFKSYSHAVAVSVVDYFERYYRSKDDPYFETREREQEFIERIVKAVEDSLNKNLPVFLSGWAAGLTQNAAVKPTVVETNSQYFSAEAGLDRSTVKTTAEITEQEIDWGFLGE